MALEEVVVMMLVGEEEVCGRLFHRRDAIAAIGPGYQRSRVEVEEVVKVAAAILLTFSPQT